MARIKPRTRLQRYESCVMKVKKKNKRVNPYAVCRASVYGDKKR